MRTKIDDFKKRDIQNIDYQSLFLELKDLCFPLFKYKQGNCHNIVHYCSMILASKGIKHRKIWYYTPAILNFNSTICISKPDPNNLVAEGNLDWGYHVALFFEETENHQIFDWIMDENKPLSLQNWISNLGLVEFKTDIEDPENYLFNIELNFDDLSKPANIEYFKYEGFAKTNHWIPTGLAINDTAFAFFNNEKEILEQNNDNSFDYKLLVGNILDFECVIRDQLYNDTVSLDFQAKHFDLIQKYIILYHQNLNKWIAIFEYWGF